MADTQDPRSVESMAFELILQKLAGLERSMTSLPPLLKKIIDYLEAQQAQPEVPIARYEEIFPALQDASEHEDETSPVAPVPVAPTKRSWLLWFMREASS